MNAPGPQVPLSPMRRVGGILLWAGILLFVGGSGYLVAYYVTAGFVDADALAAPGNGNLGAGLGSVCLGGAVMFAGLILTLVGRRRQQVGGR